MRGETAHRASWLVLAGTLIAGFFSSSLALAQAEVVYLAFGDSITSGVGDDPTRERLGYPPRLETLLRNAGENARIINLGVGGEKTFGGLARIDDVLRDNPANVLLLMEGSNNISQEFSINGAREDLAEMGRRARVRGLRVVHATVIPRTPRAREDATNILNQQLNESIRHMTGTRPDRSLADHFEVFGAIPDLYSTYYDPGLDDFVGHPNARGYDIMAQTWFDAIRGNDTLPPVTGLTTPPTGTRRVRANQVLDLDLWDFGAGIDLQNTSILINGQPATVQVTGNTRLAEFKVEPPSTGWPGVVRVGVRSRDLANPAHAVDREVSRFYIQGVQFLTGDVNRDGRVDGRDLVLLARSFGRRAGESQFDLGADLNDDDIVDGVDLAALAANFGRSL